MIRQFWLAARIRGVYEPLACALICGWVGWDDSLRNQTELAVFVALLACTCLTSAACLAWCAPDRRRAIIAHAQ